MKHSIHYTNLPDYFVLYDIYDRITNTFLSRDRVEKLLADGTIHIVPIIFKGKTTLENLAKLVDTKSKFYDGPVEGIYVRAYENNIVKYRGKIVRHDFLCGSTTTKTTKDGTETTILDHWTKREYVVNKLSY